MAFFEKPFEIIISFFKHFYNLDYEFFYGARGYFGYEKNLVIYLLILSNIILIFNYQKLFIFLNLFFFPLSFISYVGNFDYLAAFIYFFPYVSILVSVALYFLTEMILNNYENKLLLLDQKITIDLYNLIIKPFIYCLLIIFCLYPTIKIYYMTFTDKYTWDKHEPILNGSLWLYQLTSMKDNDFYVYFHDIPQFKTHFIKNKKMDDYDFIYRCYLPDETKYNSSNDAIVLNKSDIINLLKHKKIYTFNTLEEIISHANEAKNCRNSFDSENFYTVEVELNFSKKDLFKNMEFLLPNDQYTIDNFKKIINENEFIKIYEIRTFLND